jgi:ABC-type glycerol-3-phosphate transport system permease component
MNRCQPLRALEREAQHLHSVERAGQSAETPLIAILGLAITVAIFSQLRTFGSNIDIIGPATFVSLIIPLAVFFAFQRYFVQGLLAGSVK